MSTDARTGQKSSGTERIEPETTDAVPEGAALIGVDARGATHWLGNPVTHDGIPVFVVDGDGDDQDENVQEWDLTETPCAAVDGDAVDAWIAHVERKRGTWARVVYNEPLAETLAGALEGL